MAGVFDFVLYKFYFAQQKFKLFYLY